jgi:hypothetical protein
MVNTEVSEVRLYHGDEIKRLVPETDPTYDEIDNAITYNVNSFALYAPSDATRGQNRFK